MHTVSIYVGTKYIFSVAGTNPSVLFFMINGGYFEKLYNKQKDMKLHVNKLSKVKLTEDKLNSLIDYYEVKTENITGDRQRFLLEYLKSEQKKLDDTMRDLLQTVIGKLISVLVDTEHDHIVVATKKEKHYRMLDIKWITSAMKTVAEKKNAQISFNHEWYCPVISPFDQIIGVDEKKVKRMTRHRGYFRDYITNESYPLDVVTAYNMARLSAGKDEVLEKNELIRRLKYPVKFEIHGFYHAKPETIKQRITRY